MMRNKKVDISGIYAGIGVGQLVGTIIAIFGAVITAAVIAGEKIGEEQAVYGAAMSLLLGSFVGGLCASSVVGEKRMIVCLLNGAVYFVMWLCVTALFFEGTYENIWVTMLLILGTSGAAGLLATKGTKSTFKGKKHRVKIR